MTRALPLERIGHITGSRVAGVLGLSSFDSREDVMREMVREYHWEEAEFTGNFLTEWGQRHEPDAIAEYELLRNLSIENHGADQITVTHDSMRLAVTPDGWITDDSIGDRIEGLVEVKCPFRGLYTHWNQKPDHEAQMRLQMFVTGREWCDYMVWRPEGMPISRIYADRDADGNEIDWMAEVWPELERFLEDFDKIVESDELSAPYLEPIENRRTDEAWLRAEAAYWDLIDEKGRLDDQLVAVKNELQDLAGRQSTKGSGLHLVHGVTSGSGGSVSYAKVVAELVKQYDIPPQILAEVKARFTSKGSPGGSDTWAYRRIGDRKGK